VVAGYIGGCTVTAWQASPITADLFDGLMNAGEEPAAWVEEDGSASLQAAPLAVAVTEQSPVQLGSAAQEEGAQVSGEHPAAQPIAGPGGSPQSGDAAETVDTDDAAAQGAPSSSRGR
jgi:hypothetical protein